MRKALFFTAYDRPAYLKRALETWRDVRGLDDWHIVARVEPGALTEAVYEQFDSFFETMCLPKTIIVNPERYGVLHHPWVGFEELFAEGFDYVVRVEDDLRVSDDILEFFSWGIEETASRDDVATIHGFTFDNGDADLAVVKPEFNPLVWGTTRGFWDGLFGPTWDHDYSTHNGTPGTEAGWDWNINTRLFPKFGLKGLYPLDSRVDNIGLVGIHSTPENYRTSASFREHPETTGRYYTVGPKPFRS